MIPRALGAVLFAACLLLAPAGAALKPQEVNIEFSAYGPSQLDILPGETVTWTNTGTSAPAASIARRAPMTAAFACSRSCAVSTRMASAPPAIMPRVWAS